MDAIILEENLHFADVDEISEYAVSSMNWAVGAGLINGKFESTLAPKDNAEATSETDVNTLSNLFFMVRK